jgi:LysR family transcriptional regulator, glycine cleavage system transcriptional activator
MNRKRAPRLSLDLLRAFRSAARHLSFTRAAREQFVTQSAVSRAIRTLEEQLDQPLFHRVNRTLTLTHAGEELYRASDEALALIDAATDRLTGSEGALAVTTTTALASTWLVPKLPRFARLHPGTDVRIFASNDMVDLEREHIDVALRFVPPGADTPNADLLVEYRTFPVCLPKVARARKRPLRTASDLADHVRLDFETIVYGRPWYDWEHWFDAMRVRPVAPAGTMRFSHYDQVVQAATEGSGIAIGKWPHLARHLREGTLCVPFGAEGVAHIGGFYLVVTPGAARRKCVTDFVAWLRAEVQWDEARAPALLRAAKRATVASSG